MTSCQKCAYVYLYNTCKCKAIPQYFVHGYPNWMDFSWMPAPPYGDRKLKAHWAGGGTSTAQRSTELSSLVVRLQERGRAREAWQWNTDLAPHQPTANRMNNVEQYKGQPALRHIIRCRYTAAERYIVTITYVILSNILDYALTHRTSFSRGGFIHFSRKWDRFNSFSIFESSILNTFRIRNWNKVL